MRVLELRELGQADHDRQAIYKPQHDRVRDQAHQFADLSPSGYQLHDAHQDDGREKVFLRQLDAAFRSILCHKVADHRRNYNGESAGRAADHGRPAAEHSRDEPNNERGEEPHLWRQTSHD